MSVVRLGIVMNGVTGRMGTNQHLVRSICAIRAQGGVALADGRRVMPDPILVGRNRQKLEALAQAHGISRVTTDLDAALPYLVGRMDICFDNMAAVREKVQERPSDLLRGIYYDSVTFTLDALKMAVEVGGADKMLYGSDYPHNIGDMRGCLSRVDALPYDQRKAARGGNALRIFKI